MARFLTRDEEVALGRRAVQQGDAEARDILIQSNIRFVESVARRYTGLGVSLEDLVQEGTLFLMKSFDYYDPERPTRFKTLAWWWVKRGIVECLTKNGVIRPPSKWDPTDPDNESRRFRYGCLSLDVCDPNGETLAARLVDPNGVDPFESAKDRNEKERVHSALRKLPHRKRHVLEMRFGIGDYLSPMGLGEIGETLGISAERARQIMCTAMDEITVHLARGKCPS